MLFHIFLHHHIVKLLNLVLGLMLILTLLLNINQILDIKAILLPINRTLPPWIFAIGVLSHITLAFL